MMMTPDKVVREAGSRNQTGAKLKYGISAFGERDGPEQKFTRKRGGCQLNSGAGWVGKQGFCKVDID